MRGFAFVTMNDGAQANAAMSALNGRELNGRTLTVNEAHPREERPRSYGGGGGGGGGGGRRPFAGIAGKAGRQTTKVRGRLKSIAPT